MGMFSKFFGSSQDIEKRLKDQYVPLFQMKIGMSASQAKSAFRDILKQAKEKSLKEGTSNLPQNFGEVLLQDESIDENIRSMLAKKRKEGVRDEDIRWWWNMHDLERRMMLKVLDVTKLAFYEKLIERDGLSEDEALKRLRKTFPIYGNPDDTTHAIGEDRPLPHELKNRIEIYMSRRMWGSERLKRAIEWSSSFNAFIRKLIKKGKI
jgi:hypothetical protein